MRRALIGLLFWIVPALAWAQQGTVVQSNCTPAGCAFTGTITVPAIAAVNGQALNLITGGVGQSINIGNVGAGLGQAFQVTTNSGGNAGDGATGNVVAVNNLFSAQFYRTPNTGYVLGGTSFQAPVNFEVNYSGTYTGGLNAPYFYTVSSDTADLTGATGEVPYMFVGGNLNTGAKGGRIAFLPSITIATALTAGGEYQPIYAQMYGQANVGGTNTGSGSRGLGYGGGAQVLLQAGATNWTLANAWGEGDLGVQTGATVRDEVMQSAVLLSSHAVAGARSNYGYTIGAQPGALNTIVNAFVVGGPDGPFPMATAGNLIGTDIQLNCGNLGPSCQQPAELLTGGLYVPYVNFSQQSGYSVYAPGHYVDGTGQAVFGGGLLVGTTSTGYKIDTPKPYVVQSVVVSTAGNAIGNGLNNYYPGDVVYGTGAPPGQYLVSHTKVLSATVVSGGSGGTNGTQTVTGTTGTGTKVQASVTVSGGAITAVLSITTAGNYTVNPTGVGKNQTTGALNAEPVTGAGLTGATLNLGMGAITVAVLVPDVFSTNVASITTIGGSGSGLVLTPTNQSNTTLALNPSGGAVTVDNAPVLTGTTTGGANAYFNSSSSGGSGYALTSGANTLTLLASVALGEVNHYLTAITGQTTLALTLPPSPLPDGQIDCLVNQSGTLNVSGMTISPNSGQSGPTGVAQTTLQGQSVATNSARLCYQWQLAATTWARMQ